MDILANLQLHMFARIAAFGIATPWADPFFVAMSYWFFFLVIAAVFIRALYKIIQAKSLEAKKQTLKEAFVLIFSVLITWMVVTLIKILVGEPRPFEVIDSVRILAPYGGGDSFPSGHTAIAAAMAGAIKPYHHRAGMLLILLALVVGISRIYLGLHFPIDVLAGFLVGLLIADVVRRLIDML